MLLDVRQVAEKVRMDERFRSVERATGATKHPGSKKPKRRRVRPRKR